MTIKTEKERLKLIQEKSQQILSELLRDEDNKYCVDCDAKGPRWASWNLGVFLCIRCAGIHRNLGVHISKVKSVNLDSWSAEQVAYMKLMGNSKARAVYEANLPDNFKRPQADSNLEAFVRAKYEQKKYIAKEWVQPPTPPPAFDIEEERKKEKEKKKCKIVKNQASSSIVDIQTNPVPRPHSSPASTEINPEKVLNKNINNSKKLPSADLFGLNTLTETSNESNTNEDDQFEAFVSCAPISTNNSNNELVNLASSKNAKDLENDEEDFFKQKVPENKKLDKESILKLYENTNLVQQNNLFNLNTNNLHQLTNLNENNFTLNGFKNLISSSTNQTKSYLNNPLFNTSTTANNSNIGFVNFSQPISSINTNFLLPQTAATNTSPSLVQSSTNPFLSTTSTASEDLFASKNNNLENQFENLNLGYKNTNNLFLNNYNPTSIAWPDTSTTNTNTVGHSLFSNGFELDKLSIGINKPIVSANPFINPIGSTKESDTNSIFNKGSNSNGLNVLNSSSNLDNNNSNWSTLSTNNTLATANLWQ